MKQLLLTAALLASVATAQAQRIDINNSQNRTEEGYTSWVVGTTTRATVTADGITVTATIDGPQQNRTLKGEWWKDGVNKYSRLVGDGVGVYGLDASGNTPQLQEGSTGITLTISGLSAGRHSLLAYHSNPSGYQGPAIEVYVDGTLALEGVAQTNRSQTPTQSAQSYITFEAREGQDVVVTYRTVPDPTVDYTQGYNTTSLFINALVFDRPNPLTTASDPWPASGDLHAAFDDGKGTLTFTPAAKAVRHKLCFGTDPTMMQCTRVNTTVNEIPLENIDPMQTYYWRIDEEDAEGNIYEGDVWSFRPRRVAFPGAEGYGRWAIGGRGGTVYHVTSLDDDDQDPQPGTLRYGILKVHGPRTIVFDVAGTICLKSRLTCSDKYVTIAGQTAPGRGIMLSGAPFGMASDGITRFLRMRVGGGDAWDGHSPNPLTSDGMGMAGADHAIMDHCSVSWTIDEAFSSRGAKNVTLQRTLISEALNRAGHKNYVESKGPDCEHGYAATIGGDCGSYHHNLLAHCEGRNWSLSGGLDGSGAYAGRHDIFNNVVYNWGSRATDGGTHQGQFVANYYKMGPSTTKKVLLQADLEGTGTGTQEYYVTGNVRENLDGTLTTDAYGETYAYKLSGGQKLDWTVFVSAPYFESQAEVETAGQAYQSVLSDVGCNQPEPDNHDERIVTETLGRTTSTRGSRSGKKGLIDRESDAEGFEGLNIVEASRPATWDTDQDGMPDWYETCTGSAPLTPDNNSVQDGFTLLEHYLNRMAEPHFVAAGEHFSVALAPYFRGFSHPTYTLSPQQDNGTDWTVGTDGTLTVTISLPRYCRVEVTATEGSSSLTRQFWFFRSDSYVPDAIATPHAAAIRPTTAAQRYDLQGRPVSPATTQKPGLYIESGRKVVVQTSR